METDLNKGLRIVSDKRHQPFSESGSRFVAAAYVLKVRSRLKLFEDETTVRAFERMLLAELSASSSEALLYLFMPDHCHILLTRQNDGDGLLSPIKRFKLNAGYWFAKIDCAGQWCSRPDDQNNAFLQVIIDRILFILNEPVRYGLVDDWRHYRYRGSSIPNFDAWLEQNASTPRFADPSAQLGIPRKKSLEDSSGRVSSIALP